LVSKQKRQVKKGGKVRKNIKSPIEPSVDNPFLRYEAAIIDKIGEGKQISNLRLAALKQAREMPVSDDSGVPVPSLPGYIFSQPAIPGASNWIQVGPTAIPHGQTISTYYPLKYNIPALVAGRLTSIVVDPIDTNIMYVGSAQGGIWKTIDGGRNWFATSDYSPSLSIGALVMDPKNRNVLYAGTGEGNLTREKIAIGRKHPESYYGCGILKTTDGGKKWILLGGEDNSFVGASFFHIAIHPLDSLTIFAATNKGLYKSTNGGEDWKQMQNNLPTSTTEDINTTATDVTIHPTNPNIAYVAFRRKDKGDKETAGIYKTDEANSENPKWMKLPIKDFVPETCRRIALSISPSSPGILYALISRDRPLNKDDNPEGREVFEDPPGSKQFWQERVIDQFYQSSDSGLNWNLISLPGKGTKSNSYPWFKDSIGGQGTYNLVLAVDPTTPDIVYLGGVSLWKAIRDTVTNEWIITDIGIPIHPDNHAFAFDPRDPFVIYAGNDGGIYKSNDGGETWKHEINEGLCITQFEFMDQHPDSDSVIFGGTQDNGTLQFRNNSAFYHSDGGDGGFVNIDSNEPNKIVHQYVGATLWYSEEGGKEDTWTYISASLRAKAEKPLSPAAEKPLFYAPFVLDQSNPRNVAFGAANGVFLATRSGKKEETTFGNWDTFIPLPELRPTEDKVSAINYVNSDLMYIGTVKGKVYQLKKVGKNWNSKTLHDSGSSDGSLPQLYIWDVATLPNDDHTIIVVMAGYGSQPKPLSHIWLREVSEDKQDTWHNISGEGNGKLPDTPINAIAIDDNTRKDNTSTTKPYTIYVGTDIGVFRSTTEGKKWIRFSQGLPVCAVYDMRIHEPTRMLRVVTHGRGIWEQKLDEESMPDVNLFVRDHLMDTGRTPSSDIAAAFEDPPYQNEEKDTHHSVTLGSMLRWDMCADIKVDTPLGDELSSSSYQMDMENVDYVKFEYDLYHRDLKSGRVSHVYVQVHNRGIKSADKEVIVKLFYTNAIANGDSKYKYPNLPADFWTSFPYNNYDTSNWKPIGDYKVLPDGPKTLTNTEPTVVGWQWNVPPSAADRIGLLVIIDSPEEDPIPENSKIFDVERLVRNERHIGLRTLRILK
jgi:photosystem II stability/assembly factor-like uncharacterized protein